MEETLMTSSEDAYDIEMVPERNWRSRAEPMLVVGIPREIYKDVQLIKKRFGIDIANIVILSYRSWGPKAAKLLIRNINKFNSLDDLLRFLEAKVSMFDERSRAIISSLLMRIKTNRYFDEVVELASEQEELCPGTLDLAVKAFHYLASRGQFHSPECIVDVVVSVKCGKKVKSVCTLAAKSVKPVVESILVGDQ